MNIFTHGKMIEREAPALQRGSPARGWRSSVASKMMTRTEPPRRGSGFDLET